MAVIFAGALVFLKVRFKRGHATFELGHSCIEAGNAYRGPFRVHRERRDDVRKRSDRRIKLVHRCGYGLFGLHDRNCQTNAKSED